MAKKAASIAAKGSKGLVKSKTAKKEREEARGKTIAQRVAQKLRENLGELTDTQLYVLQDQKTARTCAEQVRHDVVANDNGTARVTMGKFYYDGLRRQYADKDSYFAALAPAADDTSCVDPALMKVN